MTKAKKKKTSLKKKVFILILFFVLLYAVGGVLYNVYYKKDDSTVKEVSSISNYGYTLKSNATALQTTEFNTLKANLESDEVDNQAYAESIAKLFVIDLYTITNKTNKYDVGGVDYVYPDGVDNYKVNVEDTLYKYVEDNSDGDRTQDLPEVKSITVSSTEETTYKIDKTSYDGYKINLTWEYVKDLDYDDSGEIIVIYMDNKYYVVEKN